ncbi:hypothetical protein CYMTET_14802 [Cymbomonas tetramitiformis]|uniref:2OG-Fe(II) oxygenase n=1 Tax=Cymbomonas tetramitiformis TaxID=36881 RepID=A0AAE0GFU6_9CHLO|nr:hypothetical protein CYMTET_14802 [Cymbomonas tetramitiformis]
MGNRNIPKFIHEELISRITQLNEVQMLASRAKRTLDWRFTLNVYKEKNSQQAGFDWHKDIAANGEITSITTILGLADFEIRPEDGTSFSTSSFPLTPGSVVLLSGESRWRIVSIAPS